jgi:hypothetical protein
VRLRWAIIGAHIVSSHNLFTIAYLRLSTIGLNF